MSEINTQKEGHLSIAKNKAALLKVKLIGLRKSLLLGLDELAKIEDLDVNIIASQAVEFAETHASYMEILQDIRAAEKALGRM